MLCALALALLPAQVAPEIPSDERWLLSARGSVTRALSQPQSDLFGTGAAGGATIRRSLIPWLSLGLDLSALVVTDKDRAPDNERLAEPKTGGLYAVSLLSRVRPLAHLDPRHRATGLFVEGGAGVGLTGGHVRPTVEAALGYGIETGGVVVSPQFRFRQVIETQNPLNSQDARFATLGLEITFFDNPAPRVYLVGAVRATLPLAQLSQDQDGDGIVDADDRCPEQPEDVDGFEDDDGCPEEDEDRDGIADADDKCPEEPETVNGINDSDGCPDDGKMTPVAGRLVVDDQVLFSTNSALLRPSGFERVKEFADTWREHPQWIGLRVEGHTDVRGSRKHNLRLSRRRAAAVRRALIGFGMQAGAIKTVGMGEQRPAVRGRSAAAHRRNRRVELVVIEADEHMASASRRTR